MNIIKTEVYFHIGLHKTGSTFFQRELFRNMKGINLMGRGNTEFNDKSQIQENKINLISDERYSCSMEFGADIKKRRKERIGEIKKICPNAKIILIIRNKKSWIKSLYSEYVKNGGYRDYDYWYEHLYDKNSADFEFYIDLLKNEFDEVLVLNFEDFKEKPDIVVKELCGFIKVDLPDYKNKRMGIRLSPRSIFLIRMLNVFFRTEYNTDAGFFPHWFSPVWWHKKLDKASNYME